MRNPLILILIMAIMLGFAISPATAANEKAKPKPKPAATTVKVPAPVNTVKIIETWTGRISVDEKGLEDASRSTSIIQKGGLFKFVKSLGNNVYIGDSELKASDFADKVDAKTIFGKETLLVVTYGPTKDIVLKADKVTVPYEDAPPQVLVDKTAAKVKAKKDDKTYYYFIILKVEGSYKDISVTEGNPPEAQTKPASEKVSPKKESGK
ncbi:MAG: hypothetical protein M1269_01150 [Chloroflexi bacterium]|nr:hypothetical protein [Chloroflexota bacterium]